MVKTARGDPRAARRHSQTMIDSWLLRTQYPSPKPLGMRPHVRNQPNIDHKVGHDQAACSEARHSQAGKGDSWLLTIVTQGQEENPRRVGNGVS